MCICSSQNYIFHKKEDIVVVERKGKKKGKVARAGKASGGAEQV